MLRLCRRIRRDDTPLTSATARLRFSIFRALRRRAPVVSAADLAAAAPPGATRPDAILLHSAASEATTTTTTAGPRCACAPFTRKPEPEVDTTPTHSSSRIDNGRSVVDSWPSSQSSGELSGVEVILITVENRPRNLLG